MKRFSVGDKAPLRSPLIRRVIGNVVPYKELISPITIIMSYTNGGQTIDKSMNGLLNFNGETVTAEDIICNTLDVNSSATFDGTATFNTNLPTSVITTTTNDNQFITRGIGNTLYAGSGILTSNNVWSGTNAYNTSLPTSTLTGTPTSTQIAPVSMLNNLYQAIVTGGFARLTTVDNAFTNNNTFNSNLPTSTLTGTPTSTQIAPVSMLNNIYARLSGAVNTFTNNNNFSGGLVASSIQTLFISWYNGSGELVEQTLNPVTGILKFLSYVQGTTPSYVFAFLPLLEVIAFKIEQTVCTFFTRVQVTTPETVNTNTTALSLTNSNATPTSLNMSLNMSGGLNGIVQAGDTLIIARTVLDSATTALTLAPWSNTTCGVRITKDDVTMRGLTNNFLATTSNITGTTTNISTTNTNITSPNALLVTQSLSAPTGFPAFKITNQVTPNPSIINMTLNAVAATANGCVQAGDNIIYSAVTSPAVPSPLCLTTNSTTTCGIRVSPTDIALTGTTTTLNATTTNINGTCIVKGAQTGSVLDAQMAIINSVAPNPNSINFACNLSAGNYNAIVQTGDSAIFSGQTVGTSRLVLTTHSNSANGVRIDGSNNDVSIYGTVTTLAGTTNNVSGFNVFINPSSALQISAPTTNIIGTNVNVTSTGTLAIGSPTTTTFVNLPSTTTTFTTATANQFITKNIGDTSYLQPVTGGYARLSTVNNTFTNSNAFDGGITSFAATTSITCNAGATINGTWTYTLIPFINVDATGADLDEAMNWRTTIAQIGVGITNLKAAINTWAAGNTFSTFLTTNEPFNLVFNASKTYGNQSFGFQKNNQNVQIANTGSINVYKNAAIMLLEQKWGVWLIHFQISLNVAANCVIHIGIGNLSTVPQTHTIVTGQTSVANAAFCLQTSMYYQNTSITAPGQSMYGVVKSTILNTVVNSVDIRFVRIG